MFTTDEAGGHELTVTAVPRPGPALDALLAVARGGTQAVASVVEVVEPRGGAAAAVDGDPGTSWLAAPSDQPASLVLTWPEPRTVDALRVVTDPGVAARRPDAVTIDAGSGASSVRLAADGTARFAPLVTDRLELTFRSAGRERSFDPYTLWTRPLGIGVSEVEVGGPNETVDPGRPVVLPCGEGPALMLDGRFLSTGVDTDLGALRSMRSIPVTVCDEAPAVDLAAGEHRLIALGTPVLAVDSATLVRTDGAGTSPVVREPADVQRWDAGSRTVEVGDRDEDTLLVVPENTNAGWTATLDGRRLEPVAVDGWQQGYVLPAGPAGRVDLVFGPGATYRTALVGGAGAVVLLAVLAALPARPTREGPARGRHRGALRVRGAVLGLVALGGMAFVGGAVGAGAVLLLWAGTAALGRHRLPGLALVAAGTSATAAVLFLTAPDGTGTARQVLAVVALGAVAAGIVPAPARSRLDEHAESSNT